MAVVKGLKAGDTFEDGGRRFTVLSVNPDGTYISKFIGVEEITQPVVKAEEKKEENVTTLLATVEVKPSYTKTEINRASIEKLEKISKELGLKTGTKLAMQEAIMKKLGL